MSAPPSKVIIVLGHSGIGKSTFLNLILDDLKVVDARFAFSSGANDCTISQEEIVVSPNLLLVDTPGLDSARDNNAKPSLDHDQYKGKDIYLVYLGNSCRSSSPLKKMSEALGVTPESINYFKPGNGKVWSEPLAWFKEGKLVRVPAERTAPTVTATARPNAPPRAVTSTKKSKTKSERVRTLFGTYSIQHLTGDFSYYAQIDRLCPDIATLKKYEHFGDRIIKVFQAYSVMSGDPANVGKDSNEDMAAHIRAKCSSIDGLALKIYTEGNDTVLNVDRIAGIFEAIVGALFSPEAISKVAGYGDPNKTKTTDEDYLVKIYAQKFKFINEYLELWRGE